MRLALCMALLFSGPVLADSVTLSCTAPTQNEDGTPLTDLAGYTFYYGTNAGGPYPTTESVDASVCGIVTQDLAPGTYYFVATAVNAQGVESVFSNEATKTVGGTAPNAPTGLVVEGDLTVYGLSQTRDRLVTYPVGTVPLGTECDGTMSANGMYLVPFDAVTFAGSVRPDVLVAQCGAG